MRPQVNRDGEGVTELEFALGMLVELSIVDIGQVTPFIKQFRTLDVSGDGRLGPEDLKLTQTLDPEKLRKLQRSNTQRIKTVRAATLRSLSATLRSLSATLRSLSALAFGFHTPC